MGGPRVEQIFFYLYPLHAFSYAQASLLIHSLALLL
jgi:hypothetical protein